MGESRTRIVLVDAGFTVRSQVELRDQGGFVGRVDLFVDECVVVEFDGLRKYAGADGQRALAAEKMREERLTLLGYEVVRVVWADLDDPAAVVGRVRRARTWPGSDGALLVRPRIAGADAGLRERAGPAVTTRRSCSGRWLYLRQLTVCPAAQST